MQKEEERTSKNKHEIVNFTIVSNSKTVSLYWRQVLPLKQYEELIHFFSLFDKKTVYNLMTMEIFTFRLLFWVYLSLMTFVATADEEVFSLQSAVLSNSYFNHFKTVSKLIDISYCITPVNKIKFPFECHGDCSKFPNTTLIYQFTGDNTLQTLTVTGYIAIDHSKELMYLSLRGTRSFSDLLTDIDSLQVTINHICLNCKIHKGFFETFDNTLLKVDEYLTHLIKAYPHYQILVMGHSLGGAIATLISYHIYDKLKFTNFKCITMGQPILGNEHLSFFLKQILKADLSDFSHRLLYRITNKGDAVPNLPISSSNGDFYEQLSGEIFISNLDLETLQSSDVVICKGKDDFNCMKNLYGSFNSHLIYFKKLGYCGYGFS